MRWVLALVALVVSCGGSVEPSQDAAPPPVLAPCVNNCGTDVLEPEAGADAGSVINGCIWVYQGGEVVDCPDCGMVFDEKGNLVGCSLDLGGPGAGG